MLTKANNRVMLTETTYEIGKKLVRIYIPAFSSLYFGLGNIWGFPAVEQVVGSLAVIATFVGVCMGLSSNQYDKSGAAYDGKMVVMNDPSGEKKVLSLELNDDPEDLTAKKSVSFKVHHERPSE